ncbi:hypothetical protein HK097_005373, partial [Rhizophlyctis rosea]
MRRVNSLSVIALLAITFTACFSVVPAQLAGFDDYNGCAAIITRKEIHDFTAADWTLFSRVIRQAATDRTNRYLDPSRLSAADRTALAQTERTQNLTVWEQLAWLHNRFNEQIHANAAFLVWHRLYLNSVERFFRRFYDPNFAFGYWATELEWDPSWWARDSVWDNLGRSIANQDLSDGPLAGIRFTEQGRGLYRAYTLSDPSVQTSTDSAGRKMFSWASLDFYNNALRDSFQEGYKNWARNVERLHGWVHVSQGGLMSTMYSPLDYVFWFHHSNVDRIWHRVQNKWNGENRDQTYQLSGSCPTNPRSTDCLTPTTPMPYYNTQAGRIQFIAQQCVQYAPQVNQPFNGRGPTSQKKKRSTTHLRKKQDLSTSTTSNIISFTLLKQVNTSLPQSAKTPHQYLTPTTTPPDLPQSFVEMFFHSEAASVQPELRAFLDSTMSMISKKEIIPGPTEWETNHYQGTLDVTPVEVYAKCCIFEDLYGANEAASVGYCPRGAASLGGIDTGNATNLIPVGGPSLA